MFNVLIFKHSEIGYRMLSVCKLNPACHSRFRGNPVFAALRTLIFWIPAGVYPRKGGGGDDRVSVMLT